MRMLRDSLVAGGVDKGSAVPATPPPPPLDTALSAWTVAASQGQMTPDGRRISTSTTGGVADAHTGIFLAALFCAFVGALGLQSLLHCAFHYCGRRRRAHRLAGLKESVLRRMPVAVYEAAAEGGAPAGAECAICLGEFEDGDAVRLLPRCRHGFHVHCIDTWLSAHSSCPICRDSLLDEGASATAAGEDTTAWMSSSLIADLLYLA